MIILVILLTLIASAGAFYFWQRHLRRSLEKEHAKQKQIVEDKLNQANGETASTSPVEKSHTVQPAEPDLPQAIDWATTISILHQQIGKLGVDYLKSRHLTTVCNETESALISARKRIGYGADLPQGTSDAAFKQALHDAGEAYVARQRLTEQLLEQLGPTKVACLQAKESWEALNATIKRLDLATPIAQEELPFSARVAITAGKSMLSQVETQLAKDCSKALARTAPTLLSKGPSKKTLLPQTRLLIPTLREVLVLQPQVDQCQFEAQGLIAQVDAFKSTYIKEPAKPTIEEVERYLRELRQWATNRLAAQRTASKSIQKYTQAVDAFNAKLDELRSLVNKLSPLVHKELDETLLLDIAGAYKLTKQLEEHHSSYAKVVMQLSQNGITNTDPVTTVSAKEAEALDNLLKLSRTLAFAVGQRTVAVYKYKSANSKRYPSNPSPPRLETDFSLDKHLQGFENYLKGIEETAKETEFIRAELAVYTSALSARRDKVESAKEMLSKFTTEIAQGLDDATGDDLRIALAAAERVCEVQYHANKWDRLVAH